MGRSPFSPWRCSSGSSFPSCPRPERRQASGPTCSSSSPRSRTICTWDGTWVSSRCVPVFPKGSEMSRVLVRSFGVSLDGYGAGPRQDLQNPLGVGGPDIMGWFFPTRVFQSMHGQGDGETGVDNGIAEQGFDNIGAWILGRNMFGPVRGPWPDESWKGWWGDEPPYHVPTFVLTHHARAPLK